MAEKKDYKVSYVSVSDQGLERVNDVYFSEITNEDKKDIKSLIFLPINSNDTSDISDLMKGFPILESLNLPSMITTNIKEIKKECPMLKSILLMSKNTVNNSLGQCVVKVNAMEEEGDNTAQFMTFVETSKDGKQTFIVNPKHVFNREIAIEEKVVNRLTPSQVRDVVSGENGLVGGIEQINTQIEDDRCKIEITGDTLEALLNIFVEKGVTFEEFTIDISNLCDKIESYKTIVKTVNQVTIKEEVETKIVETYTNILQRHYDNLLKDLSETISKLVTGVTPETEDLLVSDLSTYIANVIVDNPTFDEDYKEGNTLDTILTELPTAIARNIKSSKNRSLARKYISQVVSNFRTNKENLFKLIDARLNDRAGLEDTKEAFAERFGLDVTRSKQAKLIEQIIEIITTKNFGTLAKEDVQGVIDRVEKEMGNGEIRSKEMLEIISRVVADYPTKEEIKQVLVDFIAKNSYSAIKITNA